MISGTRYRLTIGDQPAARLVARHRARPDRDLHQQAHPGAVRRSGRRARASPRSAARRRTRTVWKSNLDLAAALAARADTALKAVGTALDRASELMVAGRERHAFRRRSRDDRARIALDRRGARPRSRTQGFARQPPCSCPAARCASRSRAAFQIDAGRHPRGRSSNRVATAGRPAGHRRDRRGRRRRARAHQSGRARRRGRDLDRRRRRRRQPCRHRARRAGRARPTASINCSSARPIPASSSTRSGRNLEDTDITAAIARLSAAADACRRRRRCSRGSTQTTLFDILR